MTSQLSREPWQFKKPSLDTKVSNFRHGLDQDSRSQQFKKMVSTCQETSISIGLNSSDTQAYSILVKLCIDSFKKKVSTSQEISILFGLDSRDPPSLQYFSLT